MNIRTKDFEIKCYRTGTRIRHSPEYVYYILYTAPNTGKQVRLNREFARKCDAQNYIKETIKITKQLIKERTKQ